MLKTKKTNREKEFFVPERLVRPTFHTRLAKEVGAAYPLPACRKQAKIAKGRPPRKVIAAKVRRPLVADLRRCAAVQ